MKNMLFILLMLSSLMVWGQDAELTIEVSQQDVRVGEPFELTISLKNAQGDIQPPDLEGFEIISGPNFSSSFSMVNGETNMASSYSYRLRAMEEGERIIPSATVQVEGVDMMTEPIKMNVTFDPNYSPSEPAIRRQSVPKKRKGIRL